MQLLYNSSTLIVAALCVAAVLPRANGHGMMCEPRQRGAYRSQKCGYDMDFPKDPVTDYCAHCLNGGTVATVSAHLPPFGWRVYEPTKDFEGSGDRAGLCGDAKGHNAHMIGGDFMPLRYNSVPMVSHYKTGGVVDFVAEIDTNHNGYFDFFLCDLDACGASDINGNCFKNGHCYKLQRVPHPDCEDTSRDTTYECGPIDEDYPGRWYLPCRNTGHVGVHIVGGPSGTMRYQLPKGVSCKHCVIQWYWATANSCAPRGLLAYMKRKNDPFGSTCESDGGGLGTYRRGMSECGGDKVPEEFWSCADVQITADGQEAGPVKAVALNRGGDGSSGSEDGGSGSSGSMGGSGSGASPTPAVATDEEEVKEDPEGVLDEAQEELEKGINETASESSEKRREEKRNAEEGHCLLEGSVCDGGVACCDVQMVCVFVSSRSLFACRFWWSLWDEAEHRQKELDRRSHAAADGSNAVNNHPVTPDPTPSPSPSPAVSPTPDAMGVEPRASPEPSRTGE